MAKHTIFLILAAAFLFPIIASSQTNKAAKDYLSVPGPVSFDNKSYKLDWSSHPSPDFYKQEYLPAGEATGKFKTMLLIDVSTDGKTIKEIAGQKVEELNQMKQTNPMVNYNAFENAASGEYMIDFLLTANAADGSIDIIERNVYRYKSITATSGEKAVLLFGVSKRAYGKDADAFLATLKTNKNELVNLVAKFALPEISIKK